VFAGAAASVVGFGIGSLLIPVFALRSGTEVAIAAAVRFYAFSTIAKPIADASNAPDPQFLAQKWQCFFGGCSR